LNAPVPSTESTVACPICGAVRRVTMPVDACVIVYRCAACGAVLRPKAGMCCIFCSYGSVRCPSMQAATDC
jgi:hypothetical protein